MKSRGGTHCEQQNSRAMYQPSPWFKKRRASCDLVAIVDGLSRFGKAWIYHDRTPVTENWPRVSPFGLQKTDAETQDNYDVSVKPFEFDGVPIRRSPQVRCALSQGPGTGGLSLGRSPRRQVPGGHDPEEP